MNPRTLAILSVAGLLALSSVLACGAEPEGPRIHAHTDEDAVPWTGLIPLEEPGEFRFLVVSDRTGEHRDGVFASAMPRINLVQPDFVVSVGDLIEGYTEDPATLATEWDEIAANVGRLQMPFFYAAGNHDMSNAVMAETWQERFGPSYYHFVYRDVLFVVLNSELFGMVHDPATPVPGPWQQDEQMEWVEEVLGEHADARWTFVVVHQPLWDRAEIHPDWLRVEELLGERPYTVFAGHYHRYTQHLRNGRDFITLATTGGGSGLRGEPWGEFDHVAQVTMTPGGPVIANLKLDGIVGADVRPEALRALVSDMARAVATEPFLLPTGDRFFGGVARFQVSNRGERPLEVKTRYVASNNVVPASRGAARVVAPGDVTTVEVGVQGLAGVPLERVSAAEALFTLTTEDANGRPVTIEHRAPILPERVFDVATAPEALTFDGRLGEWADVPFAMVTPAETYGHAQHDGPDDASFRFAVTEAEDGLVVAIAVRDDSIVASPSRVAREQDAVILSVDARAEAERNANVDTRTAINTGAFQKLVSTFVTLGEAKPDQILDLFAGGKETGVQQRAARTAEGWSAEVKIPFETLDDARGGAWDGVRLNVSYTDFDEGEKDHTELFWRPSRFGHAAAPGSGSFRRP